VDNDLALKIYIKARATPKVVAAFAERREFDKILIYSKQVCFLVLLKSCFQLLPAIPELSFEFCCWPTTWFQVGYTPDYLFLLQTILRTDPQVTDLFKQNWPFIRHLIFGCGLHSRSVFC